MWENAEVMRKKASQLYSHPQDNNCEHSGLFFPLVLQCIFFSHNYDQMVYFSMYLLCFYESFEEQT